MISFPNAKINLGLQITGKREDGYHNIRSVFIPVKLCDILEFVPSGKDSFTTSGLEIPGEHESNLVLKALEQVRKVHDIPPLNIHLHKVIPMGAGLGGGSSDGAFMLKMLNNYFRIGLDEDELLRMASGLGSDCSFFIKNRPQMVSGTGEILEDIDTGQENFKILLIDPGFHISTVQAYSGVKANSNPPSLEEILKDRSSNWRSMLKNDFETNIFPEFPVLSKIKEQLYKEGAQYASMSGSGSALYGLFNKLPGKKDFFPGRVIFSGDLEL